MHNRKLSLIVVRSVLLCILACCVPAHAQSRLVAAASPEQRSYPHQFRGVPGDRLLSPIDRRLDFPDGSGTIDFWTSRNWSRPENHQFFTVLCNGEAVERKDEDGTAKWSFEPRYAVYLADSHLFFQTGAKVWKVPLGQDEKLDFRTVRMHVAISIDASRRMIDVYVNGQRGATIINVELEGTGVGRLSVGSTRDAKGEFSLQVGDLDAETYDIKDTAKDFVGSVADLRVWSTSFDPKIFISGIDPAPILQRNQDDIERTIAFPGVNEDAAIQRPTYQDLILYSNFRGPAATHSLKLQYAIEGRWLNGTRQSPRMDGALAKTIADAVPSSPVETFGNVVMPWVITIVPVDEQRSAWLVYLDSAYSGYIADSGDKDGSLVFVPSRDVDQNNIPIPVRKFVVDGDSLRMTDSIASAAFGGRDGQPTKYLELVRPTGAWMGKTIDADDPFWKDASVNFTSLCYKAYNPPKMPLRGIHLDPRGDTGSSKFIFREPRRGDFRWNQDAGKALPNTLSYINIASGSGTEVSTTTFSEAETIVEESQKFGTTLHVNMFVTHDATTSNTTASTNRTLSRSESVTTNTKLIVKSHAMVLNMSRAELDEGFVRRIEQLRDSKNLARDYAAFVEEWGTHYAAAVTYGAMSETVYRLSKSDTEKALESKTNVESTSAWGFEMSGSLTLGQNVGGAISPISSSVSATMNIKTEFSKGESESKDKKFNDNSKSSKSTSSRTTYVYGSASVSADGGSVTADRPVPLFFDLRPIYELLSPQFFSDWRIINEVRPRLRAEIENYHGRFIGQVATTRVVAPQANANTNERLNAYQLALRDRLAAFEYYGLLVPPSGPLQEPLGNWSMAGPFYPADGESETFLPELDPTSSLLAWWPVPAQSKPISASTAADRPGSRLTLSLDTIDPGSLVYFRRRIEARKDSSYTLDLHGAIGDARVFVNGKPVPTRPSVAATASPRADSSALCDLRFERGWNDIVVAIKTPNSPPRDNTISFDLTNTYVWAIVNLNELGRTFVPKPSTLAPGGLLSRSIKLGDEVVLEIGWSFEAPRDASALAKRSFEVERMWPDAANFVTKASRFVDIDAPRTGAFYRVRSLSGGKVSPWSEPLYVAPSTLSR